MLAAVITCSDRAVSGAYSDRSGPLLRQALDALGFETRDPRIVPDNLVMIRAAIREAVASGSRVVLTTGGTGVGPRDVTAEATSTDHAREHNHGQGQHDDLVNTGHHRRHS